MNDYWHAISVEHQDKVRELAESHGVTLNCAFRNIVRHLEWEMEQMAVNGSFQRFVTARRIENMIELIAR